jgi:hypothetical protein
MKILLLILSGSTLGLAISTFLWHARAKEHEQERDVEQAYNRVLNLKIDELKGEWQIAQNEILKYANQTLQPPVEVVTKLPRRPTALKKTKVN